jgi:hypothetical protein
MIILLLFAACLFVFAVLLNSDENYRHKEGMREMRMIAARRMRLENPGAYARMRLEDWIYNWRSWILWAMCAALILIVLASHH